MIGHTNLLRNLFSGRRELIEKPQIVKIIGGDHVDYILVAAPYIFR